MLVCGLALCGAAAAVGVRLLSGQDWLAKVPALPATPEAAYTQWDDTAGVLKPAEAANRVDAGIQSELLELARPHEQPDVPARAVSAHDRALASRIALFPGNTTTVQTVQAARRAQADLLQKWHAELGSADQRRVMARTALPACHNEAGAPSAQSIREVELSFIQQRHDIAVRYLGLAQPLTDQLLAAVSPRIAWGDAALKAWNQLHNAALQSDLSPLAHALQSDSLRDVQSMQEFIQEFSKLAARPVADRKALDRLYAQAQGC